jgi:hypothetical protein
VKGAKIVERGFATLQKETNADYKLLLANQALADMAGQLWAVNSLGGFFYSLNLSDELRTALQPESRFRQFCDAKDAGGKQKGQTFTWDIVQDVATAGGTLVETRPCPKRTSRSSRAR